MSTRHLAESTPLVAFQKQLCDVAQQLREGMDVAPAQRLRLEGFAEALIASGADADTLEQLCAATGSDVMKIERDGDAVRFECWQQRAPVYPSTAD